MDENKWHVEVQKENGDWKRIKLKGSGMNNILLSKILPEVEKNKCVNLNVMQKI